MRLFGIANKDISMRKLVIIETIVAILFVSIFYFFNNVFVKNASIVFYDTTKDFTYRASIATKGESIIFKQLYRSNLYDINIPQQTIQHANNKLTSNIIKSTNGIYIKLNTENDNFTRKERLGDISYQAYITNKGIMVLVIIYLFVSFVCFFGTRQLFLVLVSVFNKCQSKNKNFAFYLFFIFILYMKVIPLIQTTIVKEDESYNDLNCSCDMQWYPSVQYWGLQGFSHSINPYNEELNGNTFMANRPNYAHLLYIIMYPFALFEFDIAKVLWAIFNNICILIVFFYIYQCIKKYNIAILCFLFLSFKFFCSQDYEIAVRGGNIALVLCLSVVLAYKYRYNFIILTICLSILLTKYTFGIPIVLAFFLCGYYRSSIFACLIHVLATSLFAYQFDLNIIESVLLPAKVGMLQTASTYVGLLTHIRFNEGAYKIFLILVLIVCFFVWFFCIMRYKIKDYSVILSSLFISFSLFQQNHHDYTMISVAIFIVLSQLKNLPKNIFLVFIHICILCIFYFFMLDGYHTYNKNIVSYSIGFLCYIYAISIIMFPKFTDFDNTAKQRLNNA